MSLYPKAEKRLIPPGTSDPSITPVGVILHVAATNTRSLFGWFNGPSGGIESHFYIRRSGKVEQYRSTRREADAQYLGNSWVAPDGRRYGFISVETAGLGRGRWNRRQLAAIQDLLIWASQTHGFPLKPVHRPRPDGPAQGGVSYHTRFPEWSNVPGKTCPGPRRKRQFWAEIAPWMRSTRCLSCPVHCPKKES